MFLVVTSFFGTSYSFFHFWREARQSPAEQHVLRFKCLSVSLSLCLFVCLFFRTNEILPIKILTWQKVSLLGLEL